MDIDTARRQLAEIGQDHLLAFVDDLPPEQRSALLTQIAAIDLPSLPPLIERYVKSDGHIEIPSDLSPATYYPRDPDSETRSWNAAQYEDAGASLIASGSVACFTVAGGQGSRLGYDGPKGCYPTGCVSGKPLFQVFAEGILATERAYDCELPWYIMTSPLNHEATVAFFSDNEHFGLDAERIHFFAQGTMPSFDKETGKILLAEKGKVATNPDGHGGAFRALVTSGALDDMRTRGVQHISYWQVDNPHVRVADPVFLGLHATAPDSSGEMSSKMLPKAEAAEKVGVFCESGGKTVIIEYSDMPEKLAKETDAKGNLRFLAGSIAIHAIGVAFVERVVNGDSLPYHRAVKKVPHVDLGAGERVEPSEPNAVKLERFIFDAVPLAESSIVYETDRVEEFAPVKNKEGVDSIVTSKQLQTERAARWLEAAGVEIPRRSDGKPDCVIEISPMTALSAAQLRRRDDLPKAIERGATVEL
ncbi:MAG: hypothetical protein CMJ31_12765 [Phycisphaerae bacterium]|nr:hypothetical protein [Phycisphaerae bacterium]